MTSRPDAPPRAGGGRLAITGATGFVGSRVAALAGQPLIALARRPQPALPGVTWVAGDLADSAALARLCDGASAVLHIAGAVNARDRDGFALANVAGTAAVIAAAEAAGVERFVHVSSLAARAPALSMYGGSKAAADGLVKASRRDWVIVRPPGVYGPGDAEMLELHRLARRGLALAPRGRLSLIHVDDLARALLALASGGPSRVILEIDDGAGEVHDGYGHADYARAIGRALGRERLLVIPMPGAALGLAAAGATLAARLTGNLPRLSRDRAHYLAHPDWVARGGNAALADIWAPRFDLAAGLADTVAGYRACGWL